MNILVTHLLRILSQRKLLRCAVWLSFVSLAIVPCIHSPVVAADDQNAEATTKADTTELEVGDTDASEKQFQPSDAVKAALLPLFTAIADADGSRATVELSIESVMHGEILSREQSTFQIASKFPDRYTIYYKSEVESKRIFSDGKTSTVALSPQAYYELPRVLNNQSVVTGAPVEFGPYPEPMLALTLAGVDPSISFLGGMSSVDALGKTKLRGRTDCVHVRGQQDDGVVWDLWISDNDNPVPLRLLVNLTPMLQASGQVHVPEGYGLSLRYDFASWRMTGAVDEKLFRFAAGKDAIKYESLDDYQSKTTSDDSQHPLLGKPAPAYTLTLLDGSKVTSAELKDKVVVLDFWATWCAPCMQAMPTIKSSVAKFADQAVVFYAVNAGENASLVSGFANEQAWGVDVVVDPDGTLTEAFSAKDIPLTLVLGRGGIVESVHEGTSGTEALKKQFHDELDVLVRGGRIASFQPE